MRVFVAFLLCIITNFASAQWILLGQIPDDMKLFVDPSTKKKVEKYPRAWFLTDYLNPERSGYRSSKALHEADCYQDRYRVLSLITFSGQMVSGDVIGSFNPKDPEWEYVSPNTMGGGIQEYLCKK